MNSKRQSAVSHGPERSPLRTAALAGLFTLLSSATQASQADINPNNFEHNAQSYGYTGDALSAKPQAAERRYWVDTYGRAAGYGASNCISGVPSTRCQIKGYLYAGTNYVYCKVRGDRDTDSQGHYNSWWLLTDLDSYNNHHSGRAYVSALYLSRWGNDVAKDNNGRTIPDC